MGPNNLPSDLSPLTSILVANRGEIASRIFRTCRKMGIRSIAVFSDADKNAPFVADADMAISIVESAPTQSYLDHDKIISVAKKTKADAIHPGYGFLSENASFAKRCKKEWIIFIGPNPEAIASMGSKSKAKTIMKKHSVPIIPGYQGSDQSIKKLTEEARKIGFPLLLKAVAGGGGKGMRIVNEEKELKSAIDSAKRESKSAFGNDELIVEKYIEAARHIEFQIFGDQHGNVIHLLERECTIQRRYQKIIEESPSPAMTDDLRKRMSEAAVASAKALKYDNAGTVEFIYDKKSSEFYFLEVNTRLQVEHPVTEEITGLDLVKMQIESAQGLPLSITQEEITGNGYAIEARLYAEDSENDFTPVTGKIERFEIPEVEDLRVESAVRRGSEISVFYDPMIAKLIVWDTNRKVAHRKMSYVLRNLVCLGTKTNQSFLLKILEDPDFRKGHYDTHFVTKKLKEGKLLTKFEVHPEALIAATLASWTVRDSGRTLLRSMPSGWRNSFYQHQREVYVVDHDEMEVNYRFLKDRFELIINDKTYEASVQSIDNQTFRVEIDKIVYPFEIVQRENTWFVRNESFGVATLVQKERFSQKAAKKIKGGYECPMPSQIIKVLVKKGQKVEKADGLVVLSSMKMENTIEAVEDGVIAEIYVKEGQNVDTGFLLLRIERKGAETQRKKN